jgi:hypothetical protein
MLKSIRPTLFEGLGLAVKPWLFVKLLMNSVPILNCGILAAALQVLERGAFPIF